MTARRTFILTLAALGAAAAGAQAPARTPRIGYVTLRSGPADFDRAFVQALAELGYVYGRNVAIDFRYAANDMQRLERDVADIVASKPDVVVVMGPSIAAMARATRTIPLVMTAISDPVGQGYAASLGRPGGNLTGVSIESTALAQKRVELLREIVPGARSIGVLAVRVGADGSTHEGYAPLFAELDGVTTKLGITLVKRLVGSAGELPAAYAFLAGRTQAVVVQVHPRFYEHRHRMFALAAEHRLPALYEIRHLVDDGGLISYGPDLRDIYRRAAPYVDRILRGAKPADLPIEQPGKLELVVNLRTAQALGVAIPPSVLLRADDVIR